MNGNPVSPRKIEALEVGMSEAEVKELLGSPLDPFQRSKSGTDWTYSRSFMWRSLVVEFDETGHLSKFYMDD
jgi:outer membrane protein assembly factor BamE (lipoprotein component of BamABCDE complex)